MLLEDDEDAFFEDTHACGSTAICVSAFVFHFGARIQHILFNRSGDRTSGVRNHRCAAEGVPPTGPLAFFSSFIPASIRAMAAARESTFAERFSFVFAAS